jgi:hypothetical protein
VLVGSSCTRCARWGLRAGAPAITGERLLGRRRFLESDVCLAFMCVVLAQCKQADHSVRMSADPVTTPYFLTTLYSPTVLLALQAAGCAGHL